MTPGLSDTMREERVKNGDLNLFVRSWRPAGKVRVWSPSFPVSMPTAPSRIGMSLKSAAADAPGAHLPAPRARPGSPASDSHRRAYRHVRAYIAAEGSPRLTP
jgi:hypothetical protein